MKQVLCSHCNKDTSNFYIKLKLNTLIVRKKSDDTEEEIQSGEAKYSTHEEVFSKARRIIDGEK